MTYQQCQRYDALNDKACYVALTEGEYEELDRLHELREKEIQASIPESVKAAERRNQDLLVRAFLAHDPKAINTLAKRIDRNRAMR